MKLVGCSWFRISMVPENQNVLAKREKQKHFMETVKMQNKIAFLQISWDDLTH
jgi:hypothetical protein